MNKLDRKDFTIAVKTGSDANKVKFAKEAVKGEAYYATDSQNLYFAQTTAGASDAFLSKITPSELAYENIYSLSFDGSDDELILPAIPELNSTSKFTISLWIRMNGVQSNAFHFISGSSSSSCIKLTTWNYNNGSGIDFSVGSGLVRYSTSPSSDFILYDNNWHHIVAVFDGSNSFMLVDGSSANVTINSAMPSTAPVDAGAGARIGSNFSISHFTDGFIDEVAIWSSALSLADATSICEGGESSDISNLDPLSWWRMGDNDGGSGTTITDQGSGGNDATLQNGPTFSTDVPS